MRLFKRRQRKEGAEEVSEASKFFSMFNLKGIFRKFALLVFVLSFLNMSSTTPGAGQNSSVEASGISAPMSEEEIYVVQVKDRIHNQLVVEVENYIRNLAPTSKLSAEMLVSTCEDYKLDIIFVMAQALLESHFGTKGVAARTNSVWNVGTYDNGRIIYTYNDPNESIEPYAKLLYENYLLLADSIDVNDKDLLHLLQDRGYINYDGKRFASAKGYENAMRKLMVKIDMETSISMWQGIRALDDGMILAFFQPDYKDDLEYDEFYALK